MNKVSFERVQEVLDYNPDSGLLVWKVQLNGRACVGQIAGCIDDKGYVVVRIDKRMYKAHRLAWLLMTGGWPGLFLDHINGVPSDNRWENLREATFAQSNANRKSRSASGIKGVRRTPNGRWRALMRDAHLGTFDTAEEAHAVYIRVAKEKFGEFFNGECLLRPKTNG